MDKKELRRKVLQLHYDLSKGNTIELVMRPDIGSKLDIDYNGNDLLSVIQYLEEKGFLKCHTNVQDSITVYGVDEVENDFPTLGPLTKNNEKSSELLEILSEIDEKLDLAKKDLLLYSELQETQHKAEAVLEQNIEPDTELWRDFDKNKNQITYWEKYPSGKYTNETGRLLLWRQFIIKTLEQQGFQKNKKQILIQKGQYFTGRQIIRKIMKKSKSTIDIQDNYANIDLLNILGEYLEENPNLKIRVLTQKTNSSFKSDLLVFTKQYGSTIQVKTHGSCHDRFIVIDGNEVYHSGHSFKDLGSRTSLISLVEDRDEKKKFVSEFESWWMNGVLI